MPKWYSNELEKLIYYRIERQLAQYLDGHVVGELIYYRIESTYALFLSVLLVELIYYRIESELLDAYKQFKGEIS